MAEGPDFKSLQDYQGGHDTQVSNLHVSFSACLIRAAHRSFAEVLLYRCRYIDPTYMIRTVAANASDNLYCGVLGQNAVHGAFAGLRYVYRTRDFDANLLLNRS